MSEHEDHITRELKAVRRQLAEILHGNGRAGLHRLNDDLYGPRDGSRRGVITRVSRIEESVEKLARQRTETTWLQRGIAVGMGIVLIEHVFDVPIAAIIRFVGGG